MRIAINLPAEVHWYARDLFAALDAAPRRAAVAGVTLALVVGTSFAATGGIGAALAAEATVTTTAPAPAAAARLAEPEAQATPEPPAPIPALAAPPAPPPGLRVTSVVMPRLGVNHYVERVGVEGGQMQSPSDGVNAVGWYAEYATPGYGGNAVFSAHETWERRHAPFYLLHLAREGDEVAVTLSDGSRLRYLVISNTRYDASRIPMGEIIWPSSMPPSEERATFITCGGRFVPSGGGLGEYLDRDVIVARRV